MSLSTVAQNSALRPSDKKSTTEVPGSGTGTGPPPPAPGGPSGSVPEPQPSVVPSGPLSQLVTYIPTETIAVYVAVSAALGEVVAPEGSKLSDADFDDHWLAFWLLLGSTALLATGLSWRAQKVAGKPRPQVPWFDVLAATAAFAVWALSLPGTPLRSVAGYDAATWSSVILLVGTTAIATSAYVFGKVVSWEKRAT